MVRSLHNRVETTVCFYGMATGRYVVEDAPVYPVISFDALEQYCCVPSGALSSSANVSIFFVSCASSDDGCKLTIFPLALQNGVCIHISLYVVPTLVHVSTKKPKPSLKRRAQTFMFLPRILFEWRVISKQDWRFAPVHNATITMYVIFGSTTLSICTDHLDRSSRQPTARGVPVIVLLVLDRAKTPLTHNRNTLSDNTFP